MVICMDSCRARDYAEARSCRLGEGLSRGLSAA
jgi:hypothetical protein